MKISNQTRVVLFAMLAVISILPGCGKKNDATPSVGVAGIQAIGAGGCASVSGATAQTLTFNGTLTPSTGLKATLPVYGYGTQTGGYGSNYYRTNIAGDSLNVYVSGSSAYAVVSLSAATVSAITGYSGGYGYNGYNQAVQICGLSIDTAIVNPAMQGQGWSGTIGGGTIKMWGNGNWINYPGTYTPVLL